jgi:hypothetical protein
MITKIIIILCIIYIIIIRYNPNPNIKWNKCKISASYLDIMPEARCSQSLSSTPQLIVYVADKSAQADLLWEKNIIWWLISSRHGARHVNHGNVVRPQDYSVPSVPPRPSGFSAKATLHRHPHFTDSELPPALTSTTLVFIISSRMTAHVPLL